MDNQQVISKRGDVYDTLAAIDRGGFTKEVNGAMREATLAAINTMGKAKVIIEITIDPDTKTEPLALRVSGAVKIKKPVMPAKASIFYPTAHGGLTREHPHQRDIEDDDQMNRPRLEAQTVAPAGNTPQPPFDKETGEILQEGGGDARETA